MNNKPYQTSGKDALLKKLKASATATRILGMISVPSLVLLFLALSDIADNEPDLALEWYIAGYSITILGIFTLTAFVTLGLLSKYLKTKTEHLDNL